MRDADSDLGPDEAVGGPARLTRRGLDALACLRAGIDAVEPEGLVHGFLTRQPDALGSARRVHLLAFGKAAAAMARGALKVLRNRDLEVADSVAVLAAGQEGSMPDGVRAFGAGHPQPTVGSVASAEAAFGLAQRAGEDDLLLALVSGGGSALLTLPPAGVSLDDLAAATRALLNAGVTIDELNCVRKHLDRLKGGRLARLAWPARVLGLVLSDVVGDRLDVIASGPLSPDPTTYADALAVLDRYGLRTKVPEPVLRHLERGCETGDDESPGADDPAFERVEVHVVGSNHQAAAAVLAEADRRGYRPVLHGTEITGEARIVGGELVALARSAAGDGRPVVILAAGETTVTVVGTGRGGRNQEVALGAALALAQLPAAETGRITVASMGTDGIDGPTDAAGAMADARTVARGRSAGVDAAAHLAENDAYGFFEAIDDLVITGATGTNVMDLMLALVR